MTMLDVAIVGAGPAGLAAATVLRERGLSTSLYDEQAAPGGQIYRGITASPLARPDILGDDYWRGASLRRAVPRAPARATCRSASVWAIAARDQDGFDLALSRPDRRGARAVDASPRAP